MAKANGTASPATKPAIEPPQAAATGLAILQKIGGACRTISNQGELISLAIAAAKDDDMSKIDALLDAIKHTNDDLENHYGQLHALAENCAKKGGA